MSDPNDTKFSFPESSVVVREDGDVVVEMRRSGKVVGELNFSMIIRTFLQAFGLATKTPTKGN